MRLSELARRTDPGGNFMKIAEVLEKKNRLFQTAYFKEANGTTTHTFPQRTSEPTGKWTEINAGVQKSLSTTIQVVEEMGMLEDYSYVDDRLMKLAKDKAAFRTSEDVAFVGGMGKTASAAFVTADPATDPRKPRGIYARSPWNAASTATGGANGGHWDCGGTGGGSVYSSILLVEWGDDSTHLIYPRDQMMAGIDQEDLGKQLIEDASNNPYTAWVTHFMMNLGICIRDTRCVQRLSNIIQAAAGVGVVDEDFLIKMIDSLPMEGEDAVMYIPRNIRSNLKIISKDKIDIIYGQAVDKFNFPGGVRRVETFLGIPMYLLESGLLTTEAET
jgi:hypothetical protein